MTESSEKERSWKHRLKMAGLLIVTHWLIAQVVLLLVTYFKMLFFINSHNEGFHPIVILIAPILIPFLDPIIAWAILFIDLFIPVATALTIVLFHLRRVWQAVLISGFWAAAGWFAARIAYWAWDERWHKITNHDLAKVAEELMYFGLIALPVMALSAYIVLVRLPRRKNSGKRYLIKRSGQ